MARNVPPVSKNIVVCCDGTGFSGGVMRISPLRLRLARLICVSALLSWSVISPIAALAQLAVAGQTSGPKVTVVDLSVLNQ